MNFLMNFKEFLSWRTGCFFCGEELVMFPAIVGMNADFTMEGEYFNIVSHYINFTFHMETGLIKREKQDVDLDTFLAQRDVVIQMKCPQCESDGQHYSYTGRFQAHLPLTHIELFSMREQLACGGIWLEQSVLSKTATIKSYQFVRMENGNGAKINPLYKIITLDIPYIDLTKTSPDKLKNKIKTCITFS